MVVQKNHRIRLFPRQQAADYRPALGILRYRKGMELDAMLHFANYLCQILFCLSFFCRARFTFYGHQLPKEGKHPFFLYHCTFPFQTN